MALLDSINYPSDLKKLEKKDLPKLADEIRKRIIDTVSKTGGHLGASLGAVELIIALHYVFNTPEDRIIWDVGHQTYTHKLLTGRKERFSTLRQYGGISGFPSVKESVYDTFNVGHSSTAVSVALGMAIARDFKKTKEKIIAVIGDGALSSGLTFEGLNNTGQINTDLIVILNDNAMFISKRVGAISSYLAKVMTLDVFREFEKRVKKFLDRKSFWARTLLMIARRFKVLLFPGMLFEEMGFSYLGPIDGHDIFTLIDIFEKIKDIKGPVFIHTITKKGKGYPLAEENPTDYHGVTAFDILNGKRKKKKKNLTYTEVFGKTLVELARMDNRVVAITAAMTEGTGLVNFRERFPDRFFDVGIAESHAVTFSAGLASYGMKPCCAIYSTFLQRALDQIIHDVCLQDLPVVFAIDRAGIVGEDGPTHQGIFDLSYLSFIPNLIIMSPKDENELRSMLKSAFEYEKPVAIRYPRGEGRGVSLNDTLKLLPLGKAEEILSGKDAYIFGLGRVLWNAFEAIEEIKKENISIGLVNLRFIKPIDESLIKRVSSKVKRIITIEENVMEGGIGQHINRLLANTQVKVLNIALPNRFIEQGDATFLLERYGLGKKGIYTQIKRFLKE